MSKVLVTEQHLMNIAAAIREKLDTQDTYRPGDMAAVIREISGYPEPTGTVSITQNGTANVKDYAAAAVNVPNSYTAADEGKVLSNGVLVEQTARTVTENGTIDTTLNDSVTVNVSGGGGNRANFEPASIISATNKLVEFTAHGIMSNVFGLGIVGNDMNKDWYISNAQNCLFADIGAVNASQTIYAVVKSLTNGGDFQGVGSNYANSGGNAPNIFTSGSRWYTSVYGNDTNTGVISTLFHVLTISIDATAKKCMYYIDGTSYVTKSISNCGRYPSICGGTLNGTSVTSSGNMAVLYGAICNECHDSATVVANHQLLLSAFSGYIGT